MKIVTRLRLLAALSCSLLGLAALGVLYFSQASSQALRQAAQAQAVARDMADLSNLASQYLAFGGARVEQQWQHLLTRLQSADTDAHLSAGERSVQVSLLHIAQAFKDIQAARQGGRMPLPGAGGPGSEAPGALEHAAFIHAETRRIYVRAAETANQATARAEQAQAHQSRAIYLLLGGTALTFAALGLGFARRMASAVRVLRSGLQRYASGDLRSGLDLSGADELTDIAQSASEMARQLEGVIAGERHARLEADRESAARSSAEDQLRESEAQYRLLFEHNLDGVMLTRPDGRILRCNAEAQRILGYDDAQLRRLGRAALFDGQDPRVEAAFAQRRRTGSYRGELTFSAADGRRFPAEVSSVIFKDGGGQEMSSVIFRDVTEVRRAEQSLRESEARYRHLVDRSPLAISVHQDGVLVLVNDSALAMFGAHDDSEILGQPVSRFVLPSDAKALNERVATLLRGGDVVYPIHTRYVRLDGGVIDVEVSGAQLQYRGRPAVQAVFSNITERVQNSAELERHRHHLEELVGQRTAELAEARDAAQAASRAKSSFLANMSHEIRTPMNAIIGLAHVLQRSQPRPEQAQQLGRIEDAAQHLLALVNDILDLSKIEAGRLQLEQLDFHLPTLLNEVRSLVREQAQAKDLALRVDCDAGLEWLVGDAMRLRQGLLNYAGNAVKFTAAGSVAIRAALVGEAGAEITVRFEVRDTGIGIDESRQTQLFTAFEQADLSTTREYGGTGLGLAITRRLAQQMGGEVGVSSRVGQGACFWFTARLTRGQALPGDDEQVLDRAATETLLREHHAGARLLLAEDNLVNREVALQVLRVVGLTAETAADGREALAMATAQSYDLILMDVQMPLMDGLAATRAIRADPTNADTPILAMTANAFADDRSACLASGMNDFVAKPVDMAAFYATLLKWLARRRPLGGAPLAD